MCGYLRLSANLSSPAVFPASDALSLFNCVTVSLYKNCMYSRELAFSHDIFFYIIIILSYNALVISDHMSSFIFPPTFCSSPQIKIF